MKILFISGYLDDSGDAPRANAGVSIFRSHSRRPPSAAKFTACCSRRKLEPGIRQSSALFVQLIPLLQISSSSVSVADVHEGAAVRRQVPLVGAELFGNNQTHLRWCCRSHNELQAHGEASTPLITIFRPRSAHRPGLGINFSWLTPGSFIRTPACKEPIRNRRPGGIPLDRLAWAGKSQARLCTNPRRHVHARGRRAAAARELTELARISVTLIEIMRIADFNGHSAGARAHKYVLRQRLCTGAPTTHIRYTSAAGIGIILDVV